MGRTVSARWENCYFWSFMRWSGARPSRKVVGATVVVGTLLVAWWWPGLTGQDQQTDVVIVSSPTFVESQEFIDRRLREEGFTTEWRTWRGRNCSFDVSDEQSFEVLVLELPGSAECDGTALTVAVKDLRATWPSRPMVVVLEWDAADPSESLMQTLGALNMSLVDPRSLIGSDGDTQKCFWWDDCPSDGRITTVESGRLTDAGKQRLARSIVSGVLR